GPLMTRGRNPSVGTTISGGVVSVRINSSFESLQRAKEELDRTVDACREALGDLVYGCDEQTLESRAVKALRLHTPVQTLVTAESCTGGLLAKMITDVP